MATVKPGTVPEGKTGFYGHEVNEIRAAEYPALRGWSHENLVAVQKLIRTQDDIYLDHAGTTLCARSALEAFTSSLQQSLFGNPHSASPSSSLSTSRIEDIRVKALDFFGADPDDFDLVFVANATAAIKLVAECFQGQEHGFWYGYHGDSHTSLVGARELANTGHQMFQSDQEVEDWIDGNECTSQHERGSGSLELFAYPAQSNLNGRRLPLSWPGRLKASRDGNSIYTLLDAAALTSTSPLDLSSLESPPDYVAIAFYKIFGFPDLGALIVRKDTAGPLAGKRYFGGGTVDMVACGRESWHIRKQGSIHEQLEDGSLPFHNILALEYVMETHLRLYGSLKNVAMHTGVLAASLYNRLANLEHFNGEPVCTFHTPRQLLYKDHQRQGPILAFNLLDENGTYVSHAEVEKLASIKRIHIRSGGLCNPGGVSSALDLAPWELKRNFSAGHRCGQESDLFDGKPAGLLRVSLGAMSSMGDVERFLDFVQEYFKVSAPSTSANIPSCSGKTYQIESLMVYPIKSCAGWQIPAQIDWPVRTEGLDWDREWCLVHQGTGKALSQKKHPEMALLRPSINFENGTLQVRFGGDSHELVDSKGISVPLSADPSVYDNDMVAASKPSDVCGDTVVMKTYASRDIARFFTSAIGTPCTLARFPPSSSKETSRHSKPHLNFHGPTQSILLSNESPVLIITRSSVNRLNEEIKGFGGKAIHASAFRANIFLAELQGANRSKEDPYAEDHWCSLVIGDRCVFNILGPCRRCQMVCIDQATAEKSEQPFVTLAKTRKKQGKVYFGVHAALSTESQAQQISVRVGNPVRPLLHASNATD